MGRETAEVSPSSEPSVGRTEAKASGPAPGKNDDLDNRSNPERIDVCMTAVDVQDTTNLQPEALAMPDAVPARLPLSGPGVPIEITEEITGHPIVARLAPDASEMEAALEERWAARIAQEIQESTRQERNQTREVSLVNDDDIVVLADKVKDVRTDSGQKKQLQWILTIMLLLLVVGGVAAFMILGDNKNNSKQVDGTEDPSDMPSVAPSFSPLPVDPLVEEMRSWIAPNREDLVKFLDPASPQSQALAWLQDDPITLTPGRSTRTVLERYVLAVLYYSTSGPSWRDDYLSDEDVCTWNNGGPAPQLLSPLPRRLVL